jgi:hypothetical protein
VVAPITEDSNTDTNKSWQSPCGRCCGRRSVIPARVVARRTSALVALPLQLPLKNCSCSNGGPRKATMALLADHEGWRKHTYDESETVQVGLATGVKLGFGLCQAGPNAKPPAAHRIKTEHGRVRWVPSSDEEHAMQD